MISLVKLILSIIFGLISVVGFSQSKQDYLKQNRFDLNAENFSFPETDFNIIGFGAYHGSAKTEDVELELIQALTKDSAIKYYLPETDYSTAYFYNKYMKSGDTLLLKELVVANGSHVAQERTIEVYKKWKRLKQLNDALPKEQQLVVVGADAVGNYRFTSKHILELIDNSFTSKPLEQLQNMVQIDTTSFSRGDLSYAYKVLDAFIKDYEAKTDEYKQNITDVTTFNHIINGVKKSMDNKHREQTIYENYLFLKDHYNFKTNKPFMRIGFGHLEKSREGKDAGASIFTRLIENNIYPRDKVISVIGYFTDSKVVWDELYDDNGNYTGYTTEAGFGIGDYEKEYFRGIQNLKDTKISDKTLFRLNKENTPYSDGNPDLIDVIMSDEKSNTEAVKGMSTTDFLDYAILISNSKASVPIYEMETNRIK